MRVSQSVDVKAGWSTEWARFDRADVCAISDTPVPFFAFTADEGAASLEESLRLIPALTATGDMPCRRKGRLMRYTADDIEADALRFLAMPQTNRKVGFHPACARTHFPDERDEIDLVFRQVVHAPLNGNFELTGLQKCGHVESCRQERPVHRTSD
jgi:hypothetical protein